MMLPYARPQEKSMRTGEVGLSLRINPCDLASSDSISSGGCSVDEGLDYGATC